jgi:hypothetical protein
MAFLQRWMETWKARREERRIARGRDSALQVREELRASMADLHELAENTRQYMHAQQTAAERMLDVLKAMERSSGAVEDGMQSAAGLLEKVEQHSRSHVRLLTEAADTQRTLAALMGTFGSERRRASVLFLAAILILGIVIAYGFSGVAGRLESQENLLRGQLESVRADMSDIRAAADRMAADRSRSVEEMRREYERLAKLHEDLLARLGGKPAAPAPSAPKDAAPETSSASRDASWWRPWTWGR